jgi:hypothetical protein
VQSVPPYEAEHSGKALSLHEVPESGNHFERGSPDSRLTPYPAHAGNELNSLNFHNIKLRISLHCCPPVARRRLKTDSDQAAQFSDSNTPNSK